MECLLKIRIGPESLRRAQCPKWGMSATNMILAAFNGLIAALAFIQLSRLYLRSQRSRWTRQKVFHCMIGAATLGYCIFFVLDVVAICQRWYCWSHACGFIAMAIPQIVFLATFLLLLSFWVDLCHQATDKEEEEEDDEDQTEEASTAASEDLIASSRKEADGSVPAEKHSRCWYCWRRSKIRGRQKFVIAVVMLIFIITIAFAFLIWIGMGDNPIDSTIVAQIYSDLFAVVIFLSGGGLAGYGLTLYTRMKRLRTGKTSADLQKVAGLAVVSVVCFSIRAFLVLLRDIDVFKFWNKSGYRFKFPAVVTFLYSMIGEVIPCIVVLWVMRDAPSRSGSTESPRFGSPTNGYQQALAQEQALLQQWIVPEDLESIVVVSRSRRIKCGRADSEGGSASNSG